MMYYTRPVMTGRDRGAGKGDCLADSVEMVNRARCP